LPVLRAITVAVLAATAVPACVTASGDTSENRNNCHPSYDPCVPSASDVDCLGASGDGPEYVGTVSVIGPDVYGLDRDEDGVGCE
jgi:hypothetical protein